MMRATHAIALVAQTLDRSLPPTLCPPQLPHRHKLIIYSALDWHRNR